MKIGIDGKNTIKYQKFRDTSSLKSPKKVTGFPEMLENSLNAITYNGQNLSENFEKLQTTFKESWDLAACHALNNEKVAPVIVKFLYDRHRYLVRRRKSFLRNIKNSKDLPIFVEECLAPSDRKLKVEASRMNLSTFTRKQDVYVFNENSSISGAVKVKDVTDLDAFKKNLCAKNNS